MASGKKPFARRGVLRSCPQSGHRAAAARCPRALKPPHPFCGSGPADRGVDQGTRFYRSRPVRRGQHHSLLPGQDRVPTARETGMDVVPCIRLPGHAPIRAMRAHSPTETTWAGRPAQDRYRATAHKPFSSPDHGATHPGRRNPHNRNRSQTCARGSWFCNCEVSGSGHACRADTG